MEKDKIAELHNELYDFLIKKHNIEKHNNDPSFMFRVRRMNNQNRLDKGYWFNGNTAYLETSFWDYKDNLHQTPVMRLVYFFESKEWWFELVARDSRERVTYFEQMGKTLNISRINEAAQIWHIKLVGNLTSAIETFIEPNGLKSKIDEYIKNNPKEEVVRFLDAFIFKKDIDKIDLFRNRKEENNSDTSNKEEVVTKLPYAILDINIENFEGIKKINEILFSQQEISQWIFLTGENSSGKTSILRALATCLTLDENNHLKKIENPKEDKLKLKITLKTPEKDEIWGINDEADEDGEILETVPFEKIAAYGASRLNMRNDGEPVKEKTATLFSDNAKLHSIERELEKNLKFDDIKAKILPIVENRISDIRREYTEGGDPQILFYEKDDKGNTIKEPVKLANLGAGYKGIIMMLGDMIIRLSDKFKNLDNIEGIVIIDEIDANLHPKYQYELPKLLSEAFPKVQFIVSTHSPIPLLGVPKDAKAIVYKVNRTVAEGITVDRLDDDIDIWRLNPNALLTSPIFGFEHILARDVEAEDITPINDYNEWEDIWEKLEKLKKDDKI